MHLSGLGISAELPSGWEGRITRRPEPAAPTGRTPAAQGVGTSGERTYPVTHLANFPLPIDRGDFGGGAVEVMTASNAFVCLLEYGPECVGTALFASTGLPRGLRSDEFGPRALQRALPNQAGLQRFFSEEGRAFCLFVVLGSRRNSFPLVRQVNSVLDGLTISPS